MIFAILGTFTTIIDVTSHKPQTLLRTFPIHSATFLPNYFFLRFLSQCNHPINLPFRFYQFCPRVVCNIVTMGTILHFMFDNKFFSTLFITVFSFFCKTSHPNRNKMKIVLLFIENYTNFHRAFFCWSLHRFLYEHSKKRLVRQFFSHTNIRVAY